MASYTQAALVAQAAANAAAPAAPAPVAEKIPPSMARFIDVEAEIPVTSVQLDGLVRLRLNISGMFVFCLTSNIG